MGHILQACPSYHAAAHRVETFEHETAFPVACQMFASGSTLLHAQKDVKSLQYSRPGQNLCFSQVIMY